MTLEAALFRPALKPVVDALLLRFRQRRQRQLRRGGGAALQDAIRELLLPHPDKRRMEAKLAQRRRAGPRHDPGRDDAGAASRNPHTRGARPTAACGSDRPYDPSCMTQAA